MQHDSSIVRYTEQVAGEIANRHIDAPLDELRVWVRLAHQREAMVSELYELSELDRRLSSGPEGDISKVIRGVVLNIWAHETSHTQFLSTLRGASDGAAGLAELQGRAEGWITRSAINGGAFGRLLIAIGGALGQVPEFARELSGMSLLEALGFHAELETTARMGYERMLQLAGQVAERGESGDAFGFTFRYDVARILCEENFHEAAFGEMAAWLRAAESTGAAPPANACASALHGLCARHLSVSALAQVARAGNLGLEAQLPRDDRGHWVSAGGLGEWFAQAGFDVPLVASSP